jgi:hypothetical protein
MQAHLVFCIQESSMEIRQLLMSMEISIWGNCRHYLGNICQDMEKGLKIKKASAPSGKAKNPGPAAPA